MPTPSARCSRAPPPRHEPPAERCKTHGAAGTPVRPSRDLDVNPEWIIRPPWPERDHAAARWRVPPLVAQILANRGLTLDDRPGEFLSPQLSGLIRPQELTGACEAAQRIVHAIRQGDKIVLYGDYDVDGMTGVACLWHALRLARANVDFYVPHRIDEGYGLNCDALRTLKADGAGMIVSVDCGITALEAARLAAQLGTQLIITDHHQPGPTLPDGAVIVHPSIGDSYSNRDLSGSGVAFKLAWAIAQTLNQSDKVSDLYREYLREALAFAALGTIADVVPLIGENRIIARHGLARLRTTPFVGLRALIDQSGLGGSHVTGYDVGFKLAPRLNAAGRMGHARLGVELLTRATAERAREIAYYLDDQNRSRQAAEKRITRQACEMVERNAMNGDTKRAIVLAADGWHPGVIGIVASRLVDRYHRPTVLIALGNGGGQGSARSVRHFDMHLALGTCADHLLEYGGHAMAAGLKITAEQVPAFTDAFLEYANNRLTASDLRKHLHIDAVVSLGELDLPTTEALADLGPFGIGNPRPLLATEWVELADEPRCVGKTGTHLQAVFTSARQRSGRRDVLRAIAFGQAAALEPLKQHRRCKVAFEPVINDFNGSRTVQMQVLGFHFPSS